MTYDRDELSHADEVKPHLHEPLFLERRIFLGSSKAVCMYRSMCIKIVNMSV